MKEEFNLEDLSRKCGLPTRTLRYYMQEGLVPAPDTAGKYARYSQKHLDHLTMIQRLKQLHLPLKEISHLISNMTEEDMRQILQYQDSVHIQNGKEKEKKDSSKSTGNLSSALEYIQHLEQKQSKVRSIAKSPSIYSQGKRKSDHQIKTDANQNTAEIKTQKESWTKIILREEGRDAGLVMLFAS